MIDQNNNIHHCEERKILHSKPEMHSAVFNVDSVNGSPTLFDWGPKFQHLLHL